jgi:hypothetical protein
VRRRHFAVLLAVALPARPARATPALEALMQDFARVPRSRAAFTEEKAIPELDLPLLSRGTLSWEAPDRLEKHTTSPIEEVVRIAGDRLTYERPDRDIHRSFSLDEQPEMRALAEAIRGTLAGDLATLRQHYRIDFEGSADGPWRMILTPLALRVRLAVQSILLSGHGTQVRGVDTEGGGGITRMRIIPSP